jgi:diguanylate cyclase (GGDEF)-like protein
MTENRQGDEAMADAIWTIPADQLYTPACIVSADNTVVVANQAWRAMAERGVDRSTATVDGELGVSVVDWRRIEALLDEVRVGDDGASASTEIDVPNLGLDRWARVVARRHDGAVLLTIVPLRTAPSGDLAPIAKQLIEDAYCHLSEGVVILGADFRITMSTGFVSNLVGRPGFANEGMLAFDEIHPDQRDEALVRLSSVLQRAGDQVSAEVQIATGDGGYRWFEAIATNLLDHPHVQGILVMLRDIEARKAAQHQLAHRATHDHLTELPNRSLLAEHLDAELRKQHDAPHYLGVIFLDLDNMKDVNDSLGHHAGDQFLLEAARRLRAGVRPNDRVYRVGGDEFVVVAPCLADDAAAVSLAERVRLALTGRTEIEDVEVLLSASVGVATAPPGNDPAVPGAASAMSLMRDADSAMYRAKRRGRARVELFAGELHERADARLRLTGALERAIELDELRLAYQPIQSLVTGRIVGVEALLRWDHPEFGELSAATFVEVAEQSGLIERLGAWALRRAIETTAPWYVASGVGLSVNVAPRQLSDPSLPALVQATLDAAGMPPTALTLEVTERTLIKGSEMAESLLALREIGIGISIDDFGTGYSALAYLRRFAADEVKLDTGFVHDLTLAPQGAAVTRAIIEMAHALDMRVTAEGVTTPEQYDTLVALGCDQAQGYLLGSPMSADELSGFLATVNALRTAAIGRPVAAADHAISG